MARTRYRIQVTEEDIKRSQKNNSYKCVVARAVRRCVPGSLRQMVDLQTIRFTLEGHRLEFLTPSSIAQYVVDFDAGDPIKPFTFSLKKPRVIRLQKHRVDPSQPKVKRGSTEHNRKKGYRHPKQTFELVESGKKVREEPVFSINRTAPTVWGGQSRIYGSRVLRYNRDRFATESRERRRLSPEAKL